RLKSQRHLPGFQPEDVEVLVRPGQAVAVRVPGPVPEMGQPLSLLQLPLAGPHALLILSTGGDIGHGGERASVLTRLVVERVRGDDSPQGVAVLAAEAEVELLADPLLSKR